MPENDLNDATMTAHKYSVMASAKKTAKLRAGQGRAEEEEGELNMASWKSIAV